MTTRPVQVDSYQLDEIALQIIEIKCLLKAIMDSNGMPHEGLNLLSGAERLIKVLECDFDDMHDAAIKSKEVAA